ncbi:deoxyribose-phosphate aldolase [Chloroflexia bacterium SDU3-3]|nr:deoxyribose-phosphate aldolase [Chloroflexia bacterium SDU3-3]
MTIARFIDHTLLKPDATPEQIETLCAEARQYGFASVCVNPIYVPLAAKLLTGSTSGVCTVIGFPLGATPTEVKVFEAENAIRQGATEVDMVLPIGLLRAGELDAVRDDIQRVAAASHAGGAICKVIIEACLLTDAEKETASRLVVEAGADFVKTSTGFSSGGATVADVALMKRVVGENAKVKAAGGIRSLADAKAMIAAGAARLGTSGGASLVREEQGAGAAGISGY